MVKSEKGTQFFKICPETDLERANLNIFKLLKREKIFSMKDIKKEAGEFEGSVADYINKWVKQDLLKISGAGKESGMLEFNSGYKKILGIGFSESEGVLTVMDLGGNILSREYIDIDFFRRWKGKNKEVEQIVMEIGRQTKLLEHEFACVGVAVPEEMSSINPKSTDILVNGVKDLWKCEVFTAKGTTAAGYGERDFGKKDLGDDIIYMHSDIGSGVVVKKEMIFEAAEHSREQGDAYLRSWSQFGIVQSSKELISRGVGTDIVEMVSGDIDKVTLEIILRAAEKKDELAEDLVKRSALALGVRVAYLVNMFSVGDVVLGGGIERKEGGFIQHVQESAGKFVLKNIVDKLNIVPGVLGKEASAIGAACLCRRKLFMEA